MKRRRRRRTQIDHEAPSTATGCCHGDCAGCPVKPADRAAQGQASANDAGHPQPDPHSHGDPQLTLFTDEIAAFARSAPTRSHHTEG